MKRQIDGAREAIGRTISMFVTEHTACTLCSASGYLDTYNNVSTYVTCPVCKGAYWLDIPVANEVLARVHWITDEAVTATPGGKYYLGDATATVDESYLELAMQCQSESGTVVVDGRTLTITKIQPVGAFDVTRYRLILTNTGGRPQVG